MIHPYGRFSVQIDTAVAKFEGGCVFPSAIRVSSSLFPNEGDVRNDTGFWQYSRIGLSSVITVSQLAVTGDNSRFITQRQPSNSMPLHGWINDDEDPSTALGKYLGGGKPSFNGGFAFSFHGLHVPLLLEYVEEVSDTHGLVRHEAAGLFGLCLRNVLDMHRVMSANGLQSSYVADEMPETILIAA